VGSKIYYVWYEDDGSNYHFCTGEMNSNIVSKGDSYGLGISDNTIKGFINGGVDVFKYNAEAISYTAGTVVQSTIDSNWNHITMTYDKSSLKLYVNGALVDESAFYSAINTNPFDLIIGDDFNGLIDEVRLSNIARAPGYLSNGALMSSIHDTGSNSNFNTISWNPTSQPPNADIKFQIATNNDESTWNFIGPDGTAGTYYIDPTGESICSDHNGDRYLKYKVYFSTTDEDETPTLQDVTINYGDDTGPPSITATSPTGTNVPVDTTITVTFSEVMDRSSTESAFSILPSVIGSIGWIGNQLVFTPSSDLEYDAVYNITIGSGAEDLDGNSLESESWEFTTMPGGSEVFRMEPDKEMDVPVDELQIKIWFEQDMDHDTTEGAITIDPYVELIPNWPVDDNLILTPRYTLKYDTRYDITISTDATNVNGQPLAQEFNGYFITEKNPEEIFWETWEPIITILTIIATLFAFLIGFLSIRRKRGKLRQYFERIDDTFNEYKKERQECEKELIMLREDLKGEVKKGKLEESHFLILDKKIDDYIREMKAQEKSSVKPELEEILGEE
jgi:hypothetical protein